MIQAWFAKTSGVAALEQLSFLTLHFAEII
jgi:hypothetical protein